MRESTADGAHPVHSGQPAGSVAVCPNPKPAFSLWPPRRPKGLDPLAPREFARRLAAFRQQHVSLPDARLLGTLHLLDLTQIHMHFGPRWSLLREKVFQIVEHLLERRTGPHDLYVVVDERLIVVLASGRRRLEEKAQIELLAGEMTARLCGLVPGGKAVRVRTLPFDLDRGLAGVVNLAGLMQRIAECEREVESAERAAFARARGQLLLAFEPVVNPRKRLIAAYRLQACWRDGEGQLRSADELFDERVVGVYDALVDGWLLEACSARLAQPQACKGTFVLPVRAETLLAARFRLPYLAACRRLPLASSRHLVFEITELPGTMPQARLREVAAYLAPFALGIAVRVYPPLLTLDHFLGTGIRFVSLQDPPEAARLPLPSLVRLRELARPAQLRTVLLGVTSESRLGEALAAHIDYVAGAAIAPLRTNPLPRRRL